ncbi:hypothetical protein IQ251_14270 [Saccharopolyspora sp. HNM0983]|uniref:Uncharacterized protein n=1 Tax=Saccharopolyspora montiporae TaxID=2781240 RepID=A0A929BBA9_9PSEU|nr:hypothetical protein [Saccharopolyspora sp. HNM0983]MBE9375615.1 hypothetical protein [Saccharopolyspora sp. HNM0983]
MPARTSTSSALATGFAGAVLLTGTAVLAVLHAGCDDPGAFLPRDGAVELVGGCLRSDDLPVVPGESGPAELPDGSDPAVQR